MDPRSCEDSAGSRLDVFLKLVVLQGAVALEYDAIDDGVLDHAHDQIVVDTVNGHICEQIGCEERFQGQVNPVRIKGIARLDEKVGLNGPRLNPLVAFDKDGPDRAAIATVFLCIGSAHGNKRGVHSQNAARHHGCCKKLTHRRHTLWLILADGSAASRSEQAGLDDITPSDHHDHSQ